MDITEVCRNLIVKAYGEYRDNTYEQNLASGASIVCKSRVLDSIALGYNKITVESPLLDEEGQQGAEEGQARCRPQKAGHGECAAGRGYGRPISPGKSCPINPDAWIDKSKTKVGYEIPFTRTFYEYKEIEPASQIAQRIEEHERALMQKLHDLFGKDGE